MSSRAYAEDWIVYFGPVLHSFPLSHTIPPNEIKSSILGQVDPYLAIPVSPTLTHTIAVSPTAAGELLLRRS